LKLGSKGRRVNQLNARLAELGFATRGENFDADTDTALRTYQQTAGIAVDGLVDEHTRFNLNLSNRDKIAPLRAQFDAMERLFAAHGNDRFLVVNIPAFSLRAFDKGKRVLESRVVIGSPTRPTPLMTTSLTGIILNPCWAPPPTILAKDIFRTGEIEPRTVARLGLKLVDSRVGLMSRSYR
jgi:L,D-transpeptidase YcbB